MSYPRLSQRTLLALALALMTFAIAHDSGRSEPVGGERLDGFNVLALPNHRFGSVTANSSLAQAKQLGARAVAIIPFLWQATPASPNLIRSADMSDAELRYAIRDAHALGLNVLVKPHVFVPE